MEEDIKNIEASLKKAFTGLPVHSIELMVNLETEWTDLLAPHRYKWEPGKLYAVTYFPGDGGRKELSEVAADVDDRLVPLEDLRAFMRPGMKRTLAPYVDFGDEMYQKGYRQALYDLMEMLGINTCASKGERDILNETSKKKYT